MANYIGILPATGEQAIIGEYEIKILRRFEGAEGVGFDATLIRNNVKIADVNQRGDGGGTWARFYNKQEQIDFNEYLALYKWTWGSEFGESFAYDEESVLNLLSNEAIEIKHMNASKKTFVKRGSQLYAFDYSISSGATSLPANFSSLLIPGDFFWNKEEWISV